jgi:hypothetical protein
MEFREVERAMHLLRAQHARFTIDLHRSRELSNQRHAEISRAINVVMQTVERLLRERHRDDSHS